jgi:hypothetical protein
VIVIVICALALVMLSAALAFALSRAAACGDEGLADDPTLMRAPMRARAGRGSARRASRQG